MGALRARRRIRWPPASDVLLQCQGQRQREAFGVQPRAPYCPRNSAVAPGGHTPSMRGQARGTEGGGERQSSRRLQDPVILHAQIHILQVAISNTGSRRFGLVYVKRNSVVCAQTTVPAQARRRGSQSALSSARNARVHICVEL